MIDPVDYGSLQAAVSLDKERGLAILSGQLLLAALELALPVKVHALQQLQAQGRTLRSHQREEPDDLQEARQVLLGLLEQIQPEPYKFYERWEILLATGRSNRRTSNLIHDLWRTLPEQVRLRPEGAGALKRLTGLWQEARGLCIKLHQDRHHASHSKADTAYHSLSWHITVLRLAEIPAELQQAGDEILSCMITSPPEVESGLRQSLQVIKTIDVNSLMQHVERAFVELASQRTALGQRWLQIHPPDTEASAEQRHQGVELSQIREEMAILQDRFSVLTGAIGPVLNRLTDDLSAMSLQLRELSILQSSQRPTPQLDTTKNQQDESAALGSVLQAYRELQELRGEIFNELSRQDHDFRFYHCIIYRELIIQALRQRVVRVEQLLDLSRQTILQKTLRSGGDGELAARLIDRQADGFGWRIQKILDGITYPQRMIKPEEFNAPET